MRISGHTLQDLIAKYEARRELLSDLAANVPGATIYEEVVDDLRSLAEAIDDTPLTLNGSSVGIGVLARSSCSPGS